MTTDIFIRTYHKDIPFLMYALQSIHKFCKGFRQIIICIPENQRDLLNHLTAEKIVTCPVYADDYLGQQVSKMQAFKYTDADMILFTDSDCIFTMETTPEDFMIDGKPFILMTPYDKVGDAICWQCPTSLAIGIPIHFEYMRRLPLLYWRETLDNANSYLQGAEKYILELTRFSEFNFLGAYAHEIEDENYEVLNTDECELPPARLVQYWSHSGISEEIKTEIENFLK